MHTTRKGLTTVSMMGALMFATSCGIDDPPDDDDEGVAIATATARPPRLVPPPEYVLDADGITRLTLEQAEILAPEGRPWGRALGKALFWDVQSGSDGNACASCHFSAGADPRIRNQLSPGFNDFAAGPTGDSTFGSSAISAIGPGLMPSGAPAGANYTLTPADFPLHKLVDKHDRNSTIHSTTNDAVSSQGAFDTGFTRLGRRHELCGAAENDVFAVGDYAARQVEPRNTPTTINAAFYFLNFWDGRANNTFNGVGVFGPRDIAGDPNKRLVVLEGGVPTLGYLAVKNASLASQAVGPPLSATEMSCSGRGFPDVGRKLLRSVPLFHQRVAPTDSLLGPFANPYGKGLRWYLGYEQLIRRTFHPKYWAAPGRFRIDGGQLVPDPAGYTQMELNFSMFWGISIMLYEQTLVSDDSRFDQWFESCRPQTIPGAPNSEPPIANPTVRCRNPPEDPTAHGFTAQEVLGFGLFNNGGTNPRIAGNPACSGCHPITSPRSTDDPLVFPTFSEAAFQVLQGTVQNFVPVERSRIDDLGAPLPITLDTIEGGSHDRGFFNLGVRPATADLGNGGVDPYGNPLSVARMFLREQAGEAVPDPTGIGDRCNTPTLVEPGGTPVYPGCPNAKSPTFELAAERHLVDGTFKTPTLRNVALTPPYFHYGGYSDLRSVMEFYARGGSKRDMALTIPGAIGDSSGTGRFGAGMDPTAGAYHGTNVDFFIRDLRSTDEQIDALVAFMLTLTDPRVQCDQAPFDHPELRVLDGHSATDFNLDGKADDRAFVLPAVGAGGYTGPKARFCLPNAGDLFAPGMEARRAR